MLNKKILLTGLSIVLLTANLSFARTGTAQKTFNVNGIKFTLLPKNSKIYKEAENLQVFKKFHTQVSKMMKISNELYYIQVTRNGRSFDFYWDKDKNALFNTKVFLTKEGKIIKPPVIIDKKLLKDSIAFTTGKAIKGEIYLFTDPQCPYCKRAEKRLGKKLRSEYKIHVILFPLSFHDRALPLVQWILRGKTPEERAKRMEIAMKDNANPMIGKDLEFKHWNDKEYHKELENYREIIYGYKKDYKPYFKSEKELKEFQTYLSNVKKLVGQAEVRGTPTFLNKNLEPVNPYRL